jgi:hypothetical protein
MIIDKKILEKTGRNVKKPGNFSMFSDLLSKNTLIILETRTFYMSIHSWPVQQTMKSL